MEHVKEGDVGTALDRFDRALSLDADYVAAYFHKGNTLVGAGRIDEAKATLLAGIEAARRKKDSHAEGEMQGLLDSLD